MGKTREGSKPKFHLLLLAGFALLFSGCELTEQGGKTAPTRIASGTKSSIGGATTGEVGVAYSVNVSIKDSGGAGIKDIRPTITAVDASNSTAGISVAPCGTTDRNGSTTCLITATTTGARTLKIVSPVSVSGNSVTFSQASRLLAFATQPACGGNCVSQTNFATQPVVQIRDNTGAVVTTDNSTVVTLSITTPGSAVLNGGVAVTATAVAGVATFAGADIDIAGTYTLTASSGSLTSAVSDSLTVVAGNATTFAFSTQPSTSAAANIAFAQQPVVRLVDGAGNTASNINCLISMTLSGGAGADSLLGTLSETSVSGVASFSGNDMRVSTTTGGAAYSLSAAASGSAACLALTGPVASDTFSITLSGVPNRIVLTQAPSTSALNQTWVTQPVLKVVDVDGNDVTTDQDTVITVSETAVAPQDGTLSGSLNLPVTNGVATFTNLKVTGTVATQAGTYPLVFTANHPTVGALTGTSVNQTITAVGLTPSQLRFSTQPSNAAVNGNLGSVTINVLDSSGNLCFNDNSTAITMSMGSGTGALSGGASRTVVNGTTTFSGLSINASGGNKTIYAIPVPAPPTITSMESVAFSISDFGTASKLTFTQQPAAVAGPPAAFSTQPIVAVQDVNGNTVTNNNTTTVTMTCVFPAGCTLLGTTTVSVVNGVATFTDLRTSAGTLTNVTLEANSSPVFTPTQSASFNVP